MNNKMKRLLLFGMLILLVLYCLSACSPEIISKAKAKEAGLALINQAFDTNVTDAEVTYDEIAGWSYVNGVPVQYGDEDPICYYAVTISGSNEEDDLYYAEVNAETGVAYYASKSESLLTPLTQDQINEATKLEDWVNEDDLLFKTLRESQAGEIAYEWVESRFHKDIALLETLDIGTYSDNVMYPRISIGYYVIFFDGAVYEVYLSWPTMEVISIQILSQSVS
jgi:hypothetical protein